MEHISGGSSFESSNDLLDSYVEDGVGVIHLKDKVFEIATDLSLKEAFFRKIRLADLLPSIEAFLILSAESVMGEEKHAAFMKTIVESFNGEMNLLRKENVLSQFIQLMCGFEKIVVSGVRGSVVGAFLGAILAADHRIVSENTVFSFPHIRYQMPPQGALAFFLPKYVGIMKAKKILLSGDSLSATQAHELGLVDEIVADDSFEQGCIKAAMEKSPVPSSVVGMTKHLMQCDLKGLETYLEMEASLAVKHKIKLPPDENHEWEHTTK
jgi:enoyl-CoA hydratase/carnithine racemase